MGPWIIGPVSGSVATLIATIYVGAVYLADWAIDKMWWRYVDELLEGYESEEDYS